MSERLAKSAGLIGVATLSSRMLGLIRDAVQSYFFGTGMAADAFVLATRIPTLLRDLFAEGAMSAAFVPTFTRYLTREGRPAAWRLGSQVINTLVVVTGVLVLLGMAFARPLTTLYGGHFAEVPGKLELAIELTRINMPFLLLIAIAAACMGMLNALRRFFVPALSPATYNVVFIASAVVFVPLFTRLGWQPILALSVGMLLGGLVQIAVQWPLLRREGYRHAWVLNPRDPGLHEVLVLMGPGTLGVAAAQVNLLVNTWLATNEPGAVTALNLAFRLMYLPIGIFGVSVATAAIPELARHAARESYADMRRTLSWGLRLMLVLSVPAAVGLMVLSRPVVQLILQRGNFDVSSTTQVAAALLFYAPGIIGYSIVKIASPSFYSLMDARTPVVISMVTILTNLVLNLWLDKLMGFRGLALGTAIAANINAVLLLTLLSRRLGGIDAARVGVALAKILAASLVMGAAAWGTAAVLQAWLPETVAVPAGVPHWLPVVLMRLVRVFGAIGVGLIVLAAAAHLLRLEEFGQALTRLAGRLRG